MPIRQIFVALAVTAVAAIALGWSAAGGPSARNTGTEVGAPHPDGAAGRTLAVERLAADLVHGPEDLAIEPSGDLLTGTADGRILRYRGADGSVEELARTSGHPLGLALDGQGRLLVADARRGRLAVSTAGEVRVLGTGGGDRPLRFTNGVAGGPIGKGYFTDSSWRYGPEGIFPELLEGQPTGRLLRYDPARGP